MIKATTPARSREKALEIWTGGGGHFERSMKKNMRMKCICIM